jgi:hypothetical protein
MTWLVNLFYAALISAIGAIFIGSVMAALGAKRDQLQMIRMALAMITDLTKWTGQRKMGSGRDLNGWLGQAIVLIAAGLFLEFNPSAHAMVIAPTEGAFMRAASDIEIVDDYPKEHFPSVPRRFWDGGRRFVSGIDRNVVFEPRGTMNFAFLHCLSGTDDAVKFISQHWRVGAQFGRCNLTVKFLDDGWPAPMVDDIEKSVGLFKCIIWTAAKVQRQFDEYPWSFQFSERIFGNLGLPISGCGRAFGGIGGFFSINQTFADELQLAIKQPQLSGPDDHQQESNNRQRISRSFPPAFLLFLLISGIAGFCTTVWLTGRTIR